ncbi:MAG: ribose-5-phosphate isomerase RpiA [Planctomycetes bacterium]|nr:ribose-5-phosphate isomerase RpiA [Planctomycetota bacterium]
MSDPAIGKRAAARAAADLVESGMRLGLGSGSTFLFALERLAERIQQDGLRIAGVATSNGTAEAARRLGVPLTTLDDVDRLDLAIDGADEIDPAKAMIKGGGAALVREKIVAASAREMVVIVDDSKCVLVLGKKFLLPVEVLPFGWQQTERKIAATGAVPTRRIGKDGKPLVTDNGNFILDCRYDGIPTPAALHDRLNAIPGVLDNGLFVGMAGRVLVGQKDGAVRRID